MSIATHLVKMSEIGVVKHNGDGPHMQLKTTLGSCVGIILSDKKMRVHGLAHIMLPEKLNRDLTIGKYADTAIPALLTEMKKKGAVQKNVKSYLVGGACMFGFNDGTGISSIGDRNVGAAREILEFLKIPVIFEETGGHVGRTITFNGETGKVSVKTLKKITMKRNDG